jgi:hypothetical protein
MHVMFHSVVGGQKNGFFPAKKTRMFAGRWWLVCIFFFGRNRLHDVLFAICEKVADLRPKLQLKGIVQNFT